MISKTAEILEIDRSNLFKKMKQYGIQKPNILEE
jgi:transcriptional regulator of acetoin/glycerol metabolism